MRELRREQFDAHVIYFAFREFSLFLPSIERFFAEHLAVWKEKREKFHDFLSFPLPLNLFYPVFFSG